jgi:hypothetical protein
MHHSMKTCSAFLTYAFDEVCSQLHASVTFLGGGGKSPVPTVDSQIL